MQAHRTWLEAALNGPWGRRLQPRIPVTVAEIVAEGLACAAAGAAIIHIHAYDPASGRQKDDADIYAAIIEGIRARSDAVVYPTIPLAGDAASRYAAIAALAGRGLLEWTVVDPGTVDLARFDDIAAGRDGMLYANPASHVRAGLELAAVHRLHPAYACYEPGFVRLGAALHARYPAAPQPIYRFMFSEGLTFGFPPERFALDAYGALLDRAAPGAPWMIAGLGVDIRPLIGAAVAAGGHVRVGLEDAPLGSDLSNRAWVEQAAAAITAAGGTLATPAELRAALAASRATPPAASRP